MSSLIAQTPRKVVCNVLKWLGEKFESPTKDRNQREEDWSLQTRLKIIRITFSYGKIQVGGIAYTMYVNAVFILNRIHK